MRILLLLITISLLSFTTFNEDLDKANGFDKYKFGAPPTTFQNLNIELDEGATKLYSSGDLPQIPGVQLEYLRLTFCKNQLSAISIATKNNSASKLMHYLLDNYGPAKSIKKNSEWQGKKVYCIYEPVGAGKDAIVSYYSNEICKQAGKK
jgi:hypothetical protein